jgi:hypothetical protein
MPTTDFPLHWIVADALPPAHWGPDHWPSLTHFYQWKKHLSGRPLAQLSMPGEVGHERAAAARSGLAAQQAWPAAAYAHWQSHAALPEQPLMLVTPCHWQLGMDSAQMLPPASLAIRPEEHLALQEALLPYWQEDGLHWQERLGAHWLLQIPSDMAQLSLPSIDAALQGLVQDLLPRAAAHPTLQRLHAEAQMLLYQHPVNEAREAQRLPTINALWFSGAGLLAAPQAQLAQLRLDTRLCDAAQSDSPTHWQNAWLSLDADLLAWAQQSDAPNRPRSLSLCGAQGFLQWPVQAPSLGLARWWQQRRTPSLQALLAPLLGHNSGA